MVSINANKKILLSLFCAVIIISLSYTAYASVISYKNLGEPNYNCTDTEKTLYRYNDCWHVNDNTLIELSCIDGKSIIYTIEHKKTLEDEWKLQATRHTLGGNPVRVILHYSDIPSTNPLRKLTWYCVDALGNKEIEHVEIDIVDDFTTTVVTTTVPTTSVATTTTEIFGASTSVKTTTTEAFGASTSVETTIVEETTSTVSSGLLTGGFLGFIDENGEITLLGIALIGLLLIILLTLLYFLMFRKKKKGFFK